MSPLHGEKSCDAALGEDCLVGGSLGEESLDEGPHGAIDHCPPQLPPIPIVALHGYAWPWQLLGGGQEYSSSRYRCS